MAAVGSKVTESTTRYPPGAVGSMRTVSAPLAQIIHPSVSPTWRATGRAAWIPRPVEMTTWAP